MQRNFGKKFSLYSAWFSLLCGAGSIAGLAYSASQHGMNHPISASLMAATFFFASCAVVLFVMSQVNPHKLEPWDGRLPDDDKRNDSQP